MKVVVQQLESHPFVYDYEQTHPGRIHPGHTVWMVTRRPSWLSRLFGAQDQTVVVEVRPGRGGPVHYPSGNAAPDWAVAAIDHNQDGSATVERAAPALQLVEGGKS